MSRVSRKAGLSPSITKGSNAINLGKNSGVDMGRKAQPSVTAGGIGITQEVTNIAGVSVSGGVSVDISPIDFGISVNPAENTISVATGAEIPGGFLGVSGGLEVNTNTGQITGGSIGGEVLGLGINVSNSSTGGLGVEVIVQIPGTPFEFSLGLSFPPKEEPKPPAGEEPNPNNMGQSPEKIIPLLSDSNCYDMAILHHPHNTADLTWKENPNIFVRPSEADEGHGGGVWINNASTWYATIVYKPYTRSPAFIEEHIPSKSMYDPIRGYAKGNFKAWAWVNNSAQIIIPSGLQYYEGLTPPLVISGTGKQIKKYIADYQGTDIWDISVFEIPCSSKDINPNLPRRILYYDGGTSSPSGSTPFPNPPPRRNMDNCCRESIKLQRLIVRHLGAERNTPKEDLPDGVTAIGSNQEGINQAFPFSVKKQWINPTAKENETIQILNDRQLALVIGGMIERLERTLGTAEFYKDSDKKLRQSEGNMLSWLTGKNKDFRYPDPNDFWVNTDDGIINEKVVEVRSIADGLRYQIEALNRLERILPIAELKDSSIPARWIYPNGKGQLRVGNLIHLCEYMIRKSDKDMGYWPQKVTIKAANPAINDDEPIMSDVHSVGDMLRVMMQQIVDAENDGDTSSNYDVRRTYLDIMAFQLTAKNNKYLQAITEYLSFDMIEEVSKIPIPFDPFAGQDRSVIEKWWIKFGFGKEELEFPTKNTEEEIEELSGKFLQNSELEVNTVKFGSLEAKKDPKTLKEALIEILKHSSASAAAVTEVASEGALDRIVDAAGLAQKLTSFLMRRDIREALSIGDLDNWISSAEKGYTDNLETESLRFPESNPFEPYGRPATQNPVIREIDTKEDKAD